MKFKSFMTKGFVGVGLGVFFCWTVLAVVSGYCAEATSGGAFMVAQEKAGTPAPPEQPVAQEEGFNKRVEETLASLKSTLHQAETRTYQNKMMALELIRLVFWIVGLLVVIAVIIPLTLLYVSRRRSLGPSALSDDMAETLVAVEERQAKLANVLKEIQGEIDYIHSMSVPDLKKLIEQAEKYIEQNEKDLERASVGRKGDAKQAPPSETPVKVS